MNELETRVEDLLVPMDVAVIGCVVNGPGEAKEAHIGLTGGTPNNLVYIDGKPAQKLNNETSSMSWSSSSGARSPRSLRPTRRSSRAADL